MALNEYEEFQHLYSDYLEEFSKPETQELVALARSEMRAVKAEDKFFFTPRFIPMKLLKDHMRRCENTIGVLNRILSETREGEKTPLSDIIPKRRQYNIPVSNMYEQAIELVDPKLPSIMESRIDGCIREDLSVMSYEINANRAGWENSRSFCDIYRRYFGMMLPGTTVDFADGWEKIIKYVLRKIGGSKAIYLTEQTGKESVEALRARGIDIDFVCFQDLERLKREGRISFTRDDVVYEGERVDLICRFLRTHQVLSLPELCECARAGNVHLINQMDAFYGGMKTLMVRLQDPEWMGSYARQEDLIPIPRSWFLRDKIGRGLVQNKDCFVLKFGNRGGGKAVYFGIEYPEKEWEELLQNSLYRFPETAMVQEYIEPSVSPVFDRGGTELQNTTCDVFVFSTDRPEFGGVFSRCSYENLVNYKTGGIKETVFV